MVEATTVPGVLARALQHGRRHCLVQAYGHVLAEDWRPEGDGEGGSPLAQLERWLATSEAMAAGIPHADGSLDPRCLLVDLERWCEAGRPALTAAGVADGGSRIGELPPGFLRSCRHLEPERPAAASALASLLADGIAGFDPERDATFEPSARRFLAHLRHLVHELPRGVFVWNVEPYDDIETPPPGHHRPLDRLVSVAAGFKSNRLLETHGFHAGTRVVFADYSAPGLRYRRRLLETWDGRDYPAFLRRLFREMPSGEAFYCLWNGATPETVAWSEMEQRWQAELAAWGGAAALARHWSRYRRLEHRFVRCDLLGDRGALLAELEPAGAAAIWWSNAFFSYVSNWTHDAAVRREIYASFLDQLAARAPEMLLYGASSDNIAVNGVRAAAYRDWFRREGGDELMPGALHRCQIPF